jgi:hypothetical protein
MRTAVLKPIFLAAVLCGLLLPRAQAEVRILASPGGQVGPFLDLFERVRDTGERVVIDGPCLSACTLVLSMVPHDRICVTRRAIDRPAGADVCRTGSVRTRAAGLSCPGARLDSPPRRIEFAPATAARARTRGDLSVLPMRRYCSSGQLTIQGMPN